MYKNIFIGNIEMHKNGQAIDQLIFTYETVIIIEKVNYLLTWLSFHCFLCDFKIVQFIIFDV